MKAATLRPARVREVALGSADVEMERRADGSILLRSPHALAAYPARLTERLAHWRALRRSGASSRSATPVAAGAA
jgi:feruloyl-CoA synthase